MSAVARRYARALFDLAEEAGTLEQAAAEIERLAALAQDPAIGPVLRSPLLSPGRRRDLAALLAREVGLSDLLTRFVRLLADHRRLAELPAVQRHMQALLDAALGRMRLTIRSASAVEPQQRDDIVAVFARLTGKQIIPTVILDPELIGGVIVEVGGKVYDGSVRTQFARLAKELTGTVAL